MNQLRLRHKNGGGMKHGNGCEVSADTFLDRNSPVGDNVEIYSSRIYGSTVSDNALISNAFISGSTIRDQVRIIGSGDGVQVFNSDLSGSTRIWDKPILMDVTLNGVLVYGWAELVGPWSLSDCIRIHKGTWYSPPRFKVIEGPNISTIISECAPGLAHIGCWCRSYDDWFRKGYRQMIGKRSGWTPQQIEETHDQFQEWRK